jgi:hypothetical protein
MNFGNFLLSTLLYLLLLDAVFCSEFVLKSPLLVPVLFLHPEKESRKLALNRCPYIPVSTIIKK